MSCIGVMFAPHHRIAAEEMARVCRSGGTVGLLSWTPEGMIGDLFRTMGGFAPAPPPGAQPPPLWGSEDHLAEVFGERVDFTTHHRETLEVTAFTEARDFGEHFKAYYGPTIATRANAERNGRAEEFDAALAAFCDRWAGATDRSGAQSEAGAARFEMEYLLSVGVRR
jgi:hypothetical protein